MILTYAMAYAIVIVLFMLVNAFLVGFSNGVNRLKDYAMCLVWPIVLANIAGILVRLFLRLF